MASTPDSPDAGPSTIARRHDLDALRAFAMLLGIVLHAAMSFMPEFPWIVQDTRQNGIYSLIYFAIHGFRMPLFFLVSGFFTAMLWRKRGTRSLLTNRFKRIAIPLLLGALTIVPAMNWISGWASRPSSSDELSRSSGTIFEAIREGDLNAVHETLDDDPDVNQIDPEIGVTPLSWAALVGDLEVAKLLIEGGADVNGRSRDGGTPLQAAAFLGRAEIVEVLIAEGADPEVVDDDGNTPYSATKADYGLTSAIAGFLQISIPNRDELEQARVRVQELLGTEQLDNDEERPEQSTFFGRILPTYQSVLYSKPFVLGEGEDAFYLFGTPIFNHLWFLWFLCWLVPGFVLVVSAIERLGLPAVPTWLIQTPTCYIWVIPLTLIPQWFMGISFPQFGPDYSGGILPSPHTLVYYSIFFGFGALYYEGKDDVGRLGRLWWLLLPFALFVLYPIAMVKLQERPITAIVQVMFAWTMCFGMIGLFRSTIKSESKVIRYLSDSAYWLYLIHLPLIIWAQAVVREWPLPATVKFLAICIVITLISLITYQLLVRHTWLGWLMNGPCKPRSLSEPTSSPIPTASSL